MKLCENCIQLENALKRHKAKTSENFIDIVNRKAYNENWETLTKKRRHFQAYFDRVTGRTANKQPVHKAQAAQGIL